jgi:hypothetical protein
MNGFPGSTHLCVSGIAAGRRPGNNVLKLPYLSVDEDYFTKTK